MGNADDSATSMTLLRLLCGPERDQGAWQRFCDRYEPKILHWCARRGLQAADAEDVTQKVLLGMLRKINSYDRARGRFRGWLKTVVDNAVKDFLRARNRRPGDQGAGDSDAARALEAIAQPESIAILVDELDTTMRGDFEAILVQVEKEHKPEAMRAFRLHVLENQKIKEVAAQLGMSSAAAAMAVKRVKDKVLAAGAKFLDRKSHPREEQS
jgi:RNA polymerase sigma factor (sigma-70 family)